jgi:hypothetical protein
MDSSISVKMWASSSDAVAYFVRAKSFRTSNDTVAEYNPSSVAATSDASKWCMSVALMSAMASATAAKTTAEVSFSSEATLTASFTVVVTSEEVVGSGVGCAVGAG